MRSRFFIILTCFIVLLTGCWDKVEINKVIFVTILAIDKLSEVEQERGGEEAETFPELIPNRYRIDYGYPNTGIFAGKGEGEPRYLLASTGVNMVDIETNMSTRLGGVISYDHTKLIVLGEDLAKDSRLVREVLDHIERSPEIGRRIHLMVATGTGDEAIKAEVPHQPSILGLYIRDIIDKPSRMARTADADLGYILRSFHESKASIIPRIISSGDEVKVAGVGVFKDYKLVGWMGEIETLQLMIMLDKVAMMTSNIQIGEEVLSAVITDSKTNMKVYEKAGKIIVSFDVEMEGNLRQHIFGVVGKPADVKYIEEIEKKIEEKVEERIITTYKQIQKEFGADIIQAGEYLRKHEPDLWESIKDNWDEIFPQTQIKVNTTMKLRRIGTSK